MPKMIVFWAVLILVWVCWVGIMPDGTVCLDRHGSHQSTCLIWNSWVYFILHMSILGTIQHLLHHWPFTSLPFASPHSRTLAHETPYGPQYLGLQLLVTTFDMQTTPYDCLPESWHPPRGSMIMTAESYRSSMIIMPGSIIVTSMRFSGRPSRNDDRLV